MNMSTIAKPSRTSAAVMVVLGSMLLAACRHSREDLHTPKYTDSLITRLSLRDLSKATTPFHGYYVADGITNYIQGLLPTNLALQAHKLAFEILGDGPAPKGLLLTLTRFDVADGTAPWAALETEPGQNGVRGTMRVANHDYGWEVAGITNLSLSPSLHSTPR
jgi:hypothetical protein